VTVTTDENTYTVSEAAALVGLTTYTLRWYEQEGLVDRIDRDTAGRRRYSERDLGFLGLLIKLRRTGMSVADMRRYTTLIRSGDDTIEQRLNLFRDHRDHVLEQITQLHRDLEAVNTKIKIYEEMVRG
jgi:DNA-binding transcriptional MerR regulator